MRGTRRTTFTNAKKDANDKKDTDTDTKTPKAGDDLGDHELDEPGQLEGQLLAALGEVVRVIADAALDRHPAVVGQDLEAGLEEVVPAVPAEVLERLYRHDPVDRAVELLPPLQPYVIGAVAAELGQQLVAVGLLVLGERQPDDVDVVLLHRALQGQTPAAADLEQRHARLEIEPVEVLVDVGDLRLRQRDVRAGEVRAAVLARRVLKHTEEVVRQVVMGLDVLKVRAHVLRAG